MSSVDFLRRDARDEGLEFDIVAFIGRNRIEDCIECIFIEEQVVDDRVRRRRFVKILFAASFILCLVAFVCIFWIA